MGSGRWGQSFLRELPWAGRKLLDAQWLRKELEVATYIERWRATEELKKVAK